MSSFSLAAQMKVTQISGSEPDYANYQITLYKTVDPFNLTPQEVGKIKIDPLGNFKLDLLLSETSYVYAVFDRWNASTIFEPGRSYSLQLPPHHPLAEAEKRSPYFSKTSIPFGLKGLPEDDINRKIQAFEISLAEIEEKYFQDLFVNKSQTALQALKSEVLSQYQASSYTFFGQYVYYRLASIDYKFRAMEDNDFIQMYMNVETLPFNNPPFYSLYNEVFTNYFYTETVLNKNIALRQAILSGKLSKLENYLYDNQNWGDNLRRITILDGINDSFYLNLYHKNLLLHLLKQVQQSDWSKKLKELAQKLYNQLTYLAVDTQVPNIGLKGLYGESLMLGDTLSQKKMNFLHFSNTNNPICRSHLDQIAQQYENYQDFVEFTILIPQSCKQMLDDKTLAAWKGHFFFVDEEALKRYNIIAFPYSYLVSKDGVFMISPAFNPLEGMIEQLNKAIVNQRRENLRKTQ